jgi:hypothetical protein
MIIAKEGAAGAEYAAVEAARIVATSILQRILLLKPNLFKDLIPADFTFRKATYTNSRGALCDVEDWNVYQKGKQPGQLGNKVGTLTLKSSCKSLKGFPSHAYFASAHVQYAAKWDYSGTQPEIPLITHLPLSHDWLIALNEWMTDKFSAPTFSADVAAYLTACPLPMLADKHQHFAPPSHWQPTVPVTLTTLAEDRPTDFKHELLVGKQIERTAYSENFGRVILFFTDKTQLVLPMHYRQKMRYRNSLPDHLMNPAPDQPAESPEFDPFQL